MVYTRKLTARADASEIPMDFNRASYLLGSGVTVVYDYKHVGKP